MTRHYPDMGSASDWLKQISHAARPIRSPNQIWVATRHQHGISAIVSQTSFRGETIGGVAKWRLFSQAIALRIFGACAVTWSEITSRRLRSLIGQLSFLLVPNMVLEKINIQENRTKQTHKSYVSTPQKFLRTTFNHLTRIRETINIKFSDL